MESERVIVRTLYNVVSALQRMVQHADDKRYLAASLKELSQAEDELLLSQKKDIMTTTFNFTKKQLYSLEESIGFYRDACIRAGGSVKNLDEIQKLLEEGK